jgi:hypothetical protein
MSSGIAAPPLPEAPISPPTECELVVERRIAQTQRQVKAMDIAGGLIALTVGVLVYLLAATAIDHWLIVGGLGFGGRLAMWLLLLAGVGTYAAIRLLPPRSGCCHR